MTKIIAVVVTYRPDLSRLHAQFHALAPQVAAVVWVDNASGVDFQAQNFNHHLIQLDTNTGIAHAQNMGIAWAKEQAATHILLMDQDSQPAPDMVKHLMQALCQRPDAAAVGPRYSDDRQNAHATAKSPFVRLNQSGWGFERIPCEPDQNLIPVDCLIASGSLIPMNVFDKVGLMRADWFIDYVDTEWCLRARQYSLPCYGVCSASMSHSLGENPFYFMGRAFPVHSPLRHYYQIRNAIFLIKTPWVSWGWKKALAWHIIQKMGFYAFILPPRLQHIQKMVKAVWHGVIR
ncbi:MAG: hypothetical protein RIR79_2172 [Pseudomonadota bacterium]